MESPSCIGARYLFAKQEASQRVWGFESLTFRFIQTKESSVKKIYYVHFGAGVGPFLTLSYKSRRAALSAVRQSLKEGWPARLHKLL